MRSNSPFYGFLFSVLIPLLLVAFVPGQTSPQSGKGAPSPAMHAAAGSSTDSSKYVGAETCKTCHEEIYTLLGEITPLEDHPQQGGRPLKQGCEACHGPGAEHVAGGGDKTKIFVFETRPARDQRPLPDLPRRRPQQAHFSDPPTQQKRRLHRLPLAASRQGKTAVAGAERAATMLRLPPWPSRSSRAPITTV